MAINSEIIRILKANDCHVDDSLTYLLSVHFGLNPTFISDIVKKKVYIAGILDRDYIKGTIKWIVPLVSQKVTTIPDDWLWIEEYQQLFTSVKPGAAGDKKEVLFKMKKAFKENPNLTKNIVIESAKAYLAEFTVGGNGLTYLQRADNFIYREYKEDSGVVVKSRLLQYADFTIKKQKNLNIVR